MQARTRTHTHTHTYHKTAYTVQCGGWGKEVVRSKKVVTFFFSFFFNAVNEKGERKGNVERNAARKGKPTINP